MATLKSISSIFYEQFLHQCSCTKKLQSQTVTRKMMIKELLNEKGVSKMLMKLKPGVNIITILHSIFLFESSLLSFFSSYILAL
jgi:hypothetical protein